MPDVSKPQVERRNGRADAKPSRPNIPKEYGISKSKKGMISWESVNEWLEKAPIYWLATATPEGKPHTVPVWGLWADGVLYIGGSPETRWMRNLAANPRLAAHIDMGSSVVILEGDVEVARTPEPAIFQMMADQSEAKYGSRPDSVGEGTYSMRARTVMAWDNNDLGHTATRWRFGG